MGFSCYIYKSYKATYLRFCSCSSTLLEFGFVGGFLNICLGFPGLWLQQNRRTEKFWMFHQTDGRTDKRINSQTLNGNGNTFLACLGGFNSQTVCLCVPSSSSWSSSRGICLYASFFSRKPKLIPGLNPLSPKVYINHIRRTIEPIWSPWSWSYDFF